MLPRRVLAFALIILSVSVITLAQSPDNTQIVILLDTGRGSHTLRPYLMDADGENLRYLSVQWGEHQIGGWGSVDCSADGNYFVFTDGDLYKLDSDGSNLIPITTIGLYYDVAISSNNRLVVSAMYITPDDGPGEIYTMNVDGTDIRRMTETRYREWDPAWSPDGRQIVFVFDDAGVRGLAVVSADGTIVRRIVEGTADVEQPHWSPDGQHIVFVSDEDNDRNIYTVKSDGTDIKQLTQDAGDNRYPRWSPDGDSISFSSTRDGDDYELYRMYADGTAAMRLTDDTYEEINQCWLVP